VTAATRHFTVTARDSNIAQQQHLPAPSLPATMSQYYGESQWLGAGSGQPTWDHQTPPPARSGEFSHDDNPSRKRTPIDPNNAGASSAVPREESAAFLQQIEGTF
jgi:hypothetical protein